MSREKLQGVGHFVMLDQALEVLAPHKTEQDWRTAFLIEYFSDTVFPEHATSFTPLTRGCYSSASRGGENAATGE